MKARLLNLLGAAVGLFGFAVHGHSAAPIVTITSPTNGTILAAPASLTIRASVSGGGNNVTGIEFFADSQSLGVDSDNPYRMDVTDLAAGTYTISAILTDNSGNKSTNSVALIINALPDIVITSPPDGVGLIAPATFSVDAAAADSDGSVTKIAFARGSTSLGTATTNPASVLVKGLGVGNYQFSAIATDNLGGARTTNIDLIVKTRPSVTWDSPVAGARLTAVTNILSGTASDSHGLASVDSSLNGGAFAAANGTTSWNTPVVLPPGTNLLRVRAVDDFGNASITNTRSVFQVVPATLTVTINGNGTISGLTNGQILDVNRGYQITAIPGVGQVFSNWTGTVTGNLATLTFLMQSNTTLIANFVPNPFLRVSGSFSGLFFETNEVRHESSGDFSLRLTTAGRFTSVLRLAGLRYRTTGLMTLDGFATSTIPRSALSPLTVAWAVDLHGLDQVTGSVSDGHWIAELSGDRATFNATTNPSPWAARHTVVIAPGNEAGAPVGHGWGTLRVTSTGLGILAGSLPDGTRVTRKAPLSKDGDWSLYVPLYHLQGSAVGWIHFDTNAVTDDLEGAVEWLRLSQVGAVYYPGGFTNQATLTGSRYVVPLTATNRILELIDGTAVLTGGNLSQDYTNTFTLGLNNHATNTGPNNFSLSFSRGSGLFKGKIVDAVTERTVSFTGAVLQKSTNGAGYFLGTNLSGRVVLAPAP